MPMPPIDTSAFQTAYHHLRGECAKAADPRHVLLTCLGAKAPNADVQAAMQEAAYALLQELGLDIPARYVQQYGRAGRPAVRYETGAEHHARKLNEADRERAKRESDLAQAQGLIDTARRAVRDELAYLNPGRGQGDAWKAIEAYVQAHVAHATLPRPAAPSNGVQRDLADRDAALYGMGFLVDGWCVAPQRVNVVTAKDDPNRAAP